MARTDKYKNNPHYVDARFIEVKTVNGENDNNKSKQKSARYREIKVGLVK